MEMRRSDRQKSNDFAWDVIDHSDYAFIAMTAADGTPYGVAVNLFRDGANLYFHCATEGRKTECLRKNPKVCVSCVSRADVVPEKLATLYSSAVAFGTAEEVMDHTEKVRLLRVMCEHYHVPVEHVSMRTEFSACAPKTSLWKISVDHISGKAREV